MSSTATPPGEVYRPNDPSFNTRAVHVGFQPLVGAEAGLVPPLCFATTYRQPGAGEKGEFFYGRLDNPSRRAVEQSLASLEEAEHGVTFASGTAAIAAVVQLLKSGDHLIASQHLYSGTWTYFTHIANRHGIEVEFVDCRNLANVVHKLRPTTRMVWVESPTNPTLDLVDLASLAALVAKHNTDHPLDNEGSSQESSKASPNVLDRLAKRILLTVDNTFLSPYFQRPLTLGADIVLHSCTKYLNGSSDVIMGVVCINSDLLREQVSFVQYIAGAIPSPFDCYMLQRSLRTLPIRMQRHMENGLAVARYLETHPFVRRVNHPGLPSHPQHQLSIQQTYGHSGMVSFYLKEDDLNKAEAFLKALKVVALASSLGGVESVASLPILMSHAGVPPEENEKAGVTTGLVRLSVGLEGSKDLCRDLDQALRAAFE